MPTEIPFSKSFGLQDGSFYCWFSDGGKGDVDFMIGQKFLEQYYSVYDTTNQRIGFVKNN